MYLAAVARPGDLHLPLYGLDVDQAARNIRLGDLPHTPCQRKAISDGRGRCDGADLVGVTAHGKILAVTEYGVKLVAVDDPLTAQPDDQTALLGHFQIFVFQHGQKECAVVGLIHRRKGRKRQYPLGKRARCQLAR